LHEDQLWGLPQFERWRKRRFRAIALYDDFVGGCDVPGWSIFGDEQDQAVVQPACHMHECYEPSRFVRRRIWRDVAIIHRETNQPEYN
jgi:hypothetical protein